MKLTLAVAAVIVAFLIGAWWGAQPRTCAVLNTAHGKVVLCSNDYRKEIGQ